MAVAWSRNPVAVSATLLRKSITMHTHDYFDISVKDIIQETEDAVSLLFDVPDALAETFHYKPGQFLTLRVLVDGKYRHRCYSLASAPGVDSHHKVTIKRVEGGLVSNALCANVQPGQLLQVQPPAGIFSPAELDADFLLLAGGSGITPVLSILKAVLAVGRGHVALVYANRDERSVIFGDELKALSVQHPDRFTIVHWLESLQGLPTSDRLAGLLRPLLPRDTFICGPAPFMDGAVAALGANGLARERIHLERFVSLPDEDAEGGQCASLDPPGAFTQLTVELDGEVHDIVWPSGQKMLDAMLAAGIDAPYSCRVGGCSACMCRIIEGEVVMATNLVLDERDLAEGWVLACQGQARSGKVRCEFP